MVFLHFHEIFEITNLDKILLYSNYLYFNLLHFQIDVQGLFITKKV